MRHGLPPSGENNPLSTDSELARLKKRREFLRVGASGRKAVASTLVLQAEQGAPESERSPSEVRVGFTVTKKNGNSVKRNRIRRRLRAAAQQLMPNKAQAGWDYVVIGRHTALDAPYDIILRDLGYTLRKIAKQDKPS